MVLVEVVDSLKLVKGGGDGGGNGSVGINISISGTSTGYAGGGGGGALFQDQPLIMEPQLTVVEQEELVILVRHFCICHRTTRNV